MIAGGHTVQDKEPKYGLVVLGFVNPKKMLTKGGVHPGDVLVLTKPLGFGVTTTALKQQKASPEDVAEVVGWMKRLNKDAGSLAVEFGLRGGTDVTGFSLLGHASEMAQASGVGLQFFFEKIPFVTCARKYAEMGTFPGGMFDNLLLLRAARPVCREYFRRDPDAACSTRRPAAACCWLSREEKWRVSEAS